MDSNSNNRTLVEEEGSHHIQEAIKADIQDRELLILEAVEPDTHNHHSMDSPVEIREDIHNSIPSSHNNISNSQDIHHIPHNKASKVDHKDHKEDSSRTKDTDNQL